MRLVLSVCAFLLSCLSLSAQDRSTRSILNDLVLDEGENTEAILEDLSSTGDPFIKTFVEDWRTGNVYGLEQDDASILVLHRISEAYRNLVTDEVVIVPESEEERISKMRPSRKLRRELKKITDTIDLSSPYASVRMDAALKLGLSQNAIYLPILEAKLEEEKSGKVRKVLQEAILLNRYGSDLEPEELVSVVTQLGELKSLRARDNIQKLMNGPEAEADPVLFEACKEALKTIDFHQSIVEFWGNLFRGLSLGSVLLMVSFGLAITFGLMGIINMAHGEFIAIGGYTCYMVQNLFASTFGVQSGAYQWFFLVSIPVSFIVAAVIGLGCEKIFIRYLYRRPLESLLATWGLSMILQQAYRLFFGAANVQVNTPDILMGNLEISGVSMSYARIFVIGFALVIVILTWLLLSKTNLGLYIRAVMQNRQMAEAMGIPVSRVNSLTFAFGCGLASLAGAALSQIANVGPSMGQTYIVDSFMVVVAGSVGNLLGAGVSAMGIGVVDQFLQPVLGPVMGKITVLVAIILFLQWKPGGLFPTKSRSLDD